MVEGGSESWRVQKAQLTVKLQCTREREKALKVQLSAQWECIRLEVQEHENQCLEGDIMQRESERSALDREQQRGTN